MIEGLAVSTAQSSTFWIQLFKSTDPAGDIVQKTQRGSDALLAVDPAVSRSLEMCPVVGRGGADPDPVDPVLCGALVPDPPGYCKGKVTAKNIAMCLSENFKN